MSGNFLIVRKDSYPYLRLAFLLSLRAIVWPIYLQYCSIVKKPIQQTYASLHLAFLFSLSGLLWPICLQSCLIV